MQMTIRARLLDLMPVVIAFAIVSLFGTIVVVEYIVRQHVAVPPAQQTPANELPANLR